MKKESESTLTKKERALKVSINEGTASSISASFGDAYITPFALELGATPFQIGILSSFSSLISPVAQLSGNKLMEKYSRKKIAMKSSLLQAIMWIPLAFLSYFFLKGTFSSSAIIYLLIGLYSLMAIFSGYAYVAWFSWLGDLVPERERGKYFSKKNKINGAIGLAALLLSGFILDLFKTKGFVLIGFTILFILAFVFKMADYFLFKKQYSPQFKFKRQNYFSIFDFLRRFDNFGKFAVYQAVFYIALMLASPFFAVYMLKGLNFDYITYTIVSLSSSVFYLIFTPLAGKFSDKHGNRKLFLWGCILFSINPTLWMFIKSPVLLILIPQLISGLANAAFTISAINFTYDAVSQKHRGICIAYTNILIGIGAFLGSLLGGWIISSLHPSIINPFIFLFLVSCIARFAISIFFVKEVKEIKKVKNLPPMHVIFSHPFKTIHAEIGWFRKLWK